MCTCGETKPHIIATRTDLDGLAVDMWDDGSITGALGIGIKGVPIRRPKTAEQIEKTRRIGRLFIGEVCIHYRAELPEVYAAAERAAKIDGLPGTLRRIYRERAARAAIPHFIWTVQHADRDGKPTERTCRLPRLWWPGYVVFDFCGGPGSARGRYVLMLDRHRDGVCEQTGFAFATLSDLYAHLDSIRART